MEVWSSTASKGSSVVSTRCLSMVQALAIDEETQEIPIFSGDINKWKPTLSPIQKTHDR